ncbi:L-histidine N(alpha)-methyltransferase [Streptomyces mirabilis]|uniref:L-histidine N(alpha)-methyltransferase n=1 Tax=Streptomyces mirabilis TaxID=68239 RepID=UPI0033C9DDB1
MFTITDDALTARRLSAELRADARRGLTAHPKQMPPKWLYDDRGSALFEEITRLPSYYPFLAESRLLADCSADIASATGARTLIELGPGAASKTCLLVSALSSRGTLYDYVPVDVSASALGMAYAALSSAYPSIAVDPVLADFTTALELPPSSGPRLVIFLGGTLGNLLPEERATFLRSVRSSLAPEDALLLGVDLVKDPATIVAAYSDATTAAFSKGILARLNRELGADFDLDLFEHVTVWDAEAEWVEMRLRSLKDVTVTLRGLDGLAVHFNEGEELRTEISAKFREAGLAGELVAAGLEMTRWYTAPDQFYGLALATPRRAESSPTR